MLAVAGATAVGVSVHDMLRGGSVHLLFASRDTGDVCEALWTSRLGWRVHSLTRLFGLPPASPASPVRSVGSSLGCESIVYVSRDLGHIVWCQKLYVDLDVEKRPEVGLRSRAELMAWRCVDVSVACGMCDDPGHGVEEEEDEEEEVGGEEADLNGRRGKQEDGSDDALNEDSLEQALPGSAEAAAAAEKLSSGLRLETFADVAARSRNRLHAVEPLPETLNYWVSVGAECISFIDIRGKVHELSIGLFPGSSWTHRCITEVAFAPYALLPPSSSSAPSASREGGSQSGPSRSAVGSSGERFDMVASSDGGVFDTAVLMGSDDPCPADGTGGEGAADDVSLPAGLGALRGRERATMRNLSRIEEVLTAWHAAEAAGEDPGPLPADIRPSERQLRRKLQQIREAIRQREVATAPQNQLEFNMSVLQLPPSSELGIAAELAHDGGLQGQDAGTQGHDIDRSRARVLPPVLAGNPGYGGSEYLAFASTKAGLCLLRYGTGWFQTSSSTNRANLNASVAQVHLDASDPSGNLIPPDESSSSSSSVGWWRWSKDVMGKGMSLARDAAGVVGDAARGAVPSWKALKILKHCQDDVYARLKDLEPLTVLGAMQTSTGAELIFFADRHQHLHELRWTQTHRHQWRHFDLTEHYDLPPVQRSAGLVVCDATSTEGQMVLVYFVDESRRLHELRQFAVSVLGGNAQSPGRSDISSEPSRAMNPWRHTHFSGDGSPDHPLEKLPPISKLCSASVLPVSREVNASVIYYLDSGTNHVSELVLQWRVVNSKARQAPDFLYIPRWSGLTTEIADFPVPSRMGVSVYTRGVIQAFTNQASSAAKRAWKYLQRLPPALRIGESNSHGLEDHQFSDSLIQDNGSFGDDADDVDGLSLSTVSSAGSEVNVPIHPTGNPEIFRHRDAITVDKAQAQKELMLRQKYVDAMSHFRDQVDVNEHLRADIAKYQQQLEALQADSDGDKRRRLEDRLGELEHQLQLSERTLREQVEQHEREAREREAEISRARHQITEVEQAMAERLRQYQGRISELEAENQSGSQELSQQKQAAAQLTRQLEELRGGYSHEMAVKIRQHDKNHSNTRGAGAGAGKGEAEADDNSSAADNGPMMLSSLGDDQCVICWDRPMKVTFEPCKHRICDDPACLAPYASGDNRKCPMCRGKIESHVVDQD